MSIDGQTSTLMLDGETDKLSVFPYTEIPVRFPGTGDIFSAVLIGKYRSGHSIEVITK